jgi:hypothetical protein
MMRGGVEITSLWYDAAVIGQGRLIYLEITLPYKCLTQITDLATYAG